MQSVVLNVTSYAVVMCQAFSSTCGQILKEFVLHIPFKKFFFIRNFCKMTEEYFSIADVSTRNTVNSSYGTNLGRDSNPYTDSHVYDYAAVEDVICREQSVSSTSGTITATMVSGGEETVGKGRSKLELSLCIATIALALMVSLAGLVCSVVLLTRNTTSTSRSETVLGMTESNPGASCFVIHLLYPHLPSGLYWIRPTPNSSVQVYCDMTFACGSQAGGWRRLVQVDFANSNVTCPNGLKKRDDNGLRSCGIASPGAICVSIKYPANDLPYRQVCGRVVAYQFGYTDAFSNFAGMSDGTINSIYVDGVSITYGEQPKKHLWTFASALSETTRVASVSCSCISNNTESSRFVPSFVGDHYSCATGSPGTEGQIFFGDNPLWDGLGCGPGNTCCSTQPRWFHRTLPLPVTEDIELRVCSDEIRTSEDVALKEVTFYVS